MNRFARIILALCAALAAAPVAPPAIAQEGALSALARLDATASEIAAVGDGLAVTLTLSQPVPWRVRVRDLGLSADVPASKFKKKEHLARATPEHDRPSYHCVRRCPARRRGSP